MLIELKDERVTLGELARVFAQTPGVQEMYLADFMHDLSSLLGVTFAVEGSGRTGNHLLGRNVLVHAESFLHPFCF